MATPDQWLKRKAESKYRRELKGKGERLLKVRTWGIVRSSQSGKRQKKELMGQNGRAQLPQMRRDFDVTTR